jgi:hypothetical protein
MFLVTAVAAGLTLLASACGTGSGGAPGASGTMTSGSAVRYASCMRAHGVPDYPDPDSAGQLQKITPANEAQLGVSQSRFTTAQAACQALWPYQAPSAALQRQELTDALKFARCMRSDGVPNWPDPGTDASSGRVEFVIGADIDLNSPQLRATARQCEHSLPASMLPGNPDGVEVTTSP